MAIFGRQPVLSRNSKSYIKLSWVRSIRDEESLDTEESIMRYVRCQIFCLLGSTLFTDKWSHSERSAAWLEKTVETFRNDIDYMQEFEWRPYEGIIVPVELHVHLDVCDIVAPLLSFECIEWHPADRVMRQFGFAQPPPPPPPANTKGHSTGAALHGSSRSAAS
ncbi:hypothetical protein Ahy_A10g050432 [Arachis hypogaea]|uniref:Aminotransferase-like plant mobile domain-containing protein n=1 Tax=Arachis hypogaea TaxID=3818 RepID=A0A445B9D2_ARAHY|nr:hypothetical protein Ahy_A10g050432 [Arachis hypogaea]